MTMTESDRPYYCGYVWSDPHYAVSPRDNDAIVSSIMESVKKILEVI